MGLWDNIVDWFTKEEKYEFDEAKKAEQEKELMDKLEQLDKDLYDKDQSEYNAGLEASKPLAPKFEYVDIDDTTDEQIFNTANDKYAKEKEEKKNEIEQSYGGKLSKQEQALVDANDAKKLKEDKLLKSQAIKEEQVKNDAIESGLINSSIVTTQKDEVANLTEKELENLDASVKKQLDKINGELEYLTSMKEQALSKHDESMNTKIDSEINALTKSRDTLIERQKKQNADTEFKQKQYEKSVLAAEEKFNSAWKDKIAKRNAEEAKNGYGGERKSNFDQRLELAKNYYMQYPKEIALQLINNNPALEKAMGYNMYKLKHAITTNGK